MSMEQKAILDIYSDMNWVMCWELNYAHCWKYGNKNYQPTEG